MTAPIGRRPYQQPSPWGGLAVFQTDAVGQGPGRQVVFAGDAMFIAATRPTLHFPLVEAVAAAEGIDLWYFDPAKWPDREPVDPATYLGLQRAGEPRV